MIGPLWNLPLGEIFIEILTRALKETGGLISNHLSRQIGSGVPVEGLLEQLGGGKLVGDFGGGIIPVQNLLGYVFRRSSSYIIGDLTAFSLVDARLANWVRV